MKKNYSIVSLVQVLLIIASTLLFSVTASSQDLTAAQKQERCQNNKNRIAELETQLKIINADLSASMTEKEIEDVRTEMTFVRSMKNEKTEISWKRLDQVSARYNFDFNNCLHNKIKTVLCLTELENIITKKINKAVSLDRPALLAKKTAVEKQIANHRTNLVALGCDDLSKSPSAGSLRLVGPEIVGKSRKQVLNATVYTEWTYTATSGMIMDMWEPPDNKRLIKWDFSGIPASLSPGQEFTITITGTVEMKRGYDLQPYASAGINASGLDVISVQKAYLSVNNKKEGIHVFKVPQNAKSVTIEIGADYSVGTFAIYRYEKL